MAISQNNIVIATHYLVYGAPQALREYLLEQHKDFVFIGHPLQRNGKSYREFIQNGKVKNVATFPIRFPISILNYIVELGLSVFWGLFFKKSTLFIGVDPLNALAGIVLKKLGRVNKVVYFTIDFVPERFSNKFLNSLYHAIDAYCVKHSDFRWNVSPRIAEGREKYLGISAKKYIQKVVPIGVWYNRIHKVPEEKVHQYQLLFIGNLLEKQGVQLVLKTIPEIIQVLPHFHFLIIGGGEYENSLKEIVQNLHINKYVTFTGWVTGRRQLDTMIADSAVAIALYDKKTDYFTYYADPTKLKDYLSAHIPIILTDVPHNAYELENAGCAKVISYNKQELLEAVISMMKNKDQLRIYRENAKRYIQKYEWSNIFHDAFQSI